MDEPYQRRFLPSTSMLIAFDVSARTGSFTAAARALSLTQGAISRQVRALEEQLGVALFHRANRKITLTEAGHAYVREIQPALSRIQAASLAIRMNPRAGQLNIAILPTFGTRWLMPRFPSFLEENPEITVHFVTRLSPFDLSSEGVHGAIHFGRPDWPQAEATFLMREESVPVASPAFIARHRIERLEDLAELPLLHLASRPQSWRAWFAAHLACAAERPGLLFEQFSTAAQAAAAGIGIALLPNFLIAREIERGELVVLFDKPLPTRSAYYLMIPAEASDYAPANAFRAWLTGQMEIDQQAGEGRAFAPGTRP